MAAPYRPLADASDRVQLFYDTPALIKLKYAEPRECANFPGRYSWSLTDGRMWFLSADEVADVNIADIKAGQEFYVTKRRGARKGERAWLHVTIGDKPARIGEPLASTLTRSVANVQARAATNVQARENLERRGDAIPEPARWENGFDAPPPARKPAEMAPAPRPRTQLEDALLTTVAACHAATEHGRGLGYSVSFTSDDVVKLACTLLIGMQGQRRSA